MAPLGDHREVPKPWAGISENREGGSARDPEEAGPVGIDVASREERNIPLDP